MKTTYITIAVLMAGVLSGHSQSTYRWSVGWSQVFMGGKCFQSFSSDDKSPYPAWSPGEQMCPLHQTNAVYLAKQKAAKTFPKVPDWELCSLLLKMHPVYDNHEIWFYKVALLPVFGTEKPEKMSRLAIAVGLNGHVPPIKKEDPRSIEEHMEQLQKMHDEFIKQSSETKPLEKPLRIAQYDSMALRKIIENFYGDIKFPGEIPDTPSLQDGSPAQKGPDSVRQQFIDNTIGAHKARHSARWRWGEMMEFNKAVQNAVVSEFMLETSVDVLVESGGYTTNQTSRPVVPDVTDKLIEKVETLRRSTNISDR